MDRPLHVIMDPRATATQQVLEQQFTFAQAIYAQLLASRKAMAELESVESQMKKLDTSDNSDALEKAIHDTQAELENIRGGEQDAHAQGQTHEAGLAEATAGLGTDLRVVESGDRTAPADATEIFTQMKQASQEGIEAWQHFKTADLATLNAELTAAHREPLKIAAIEEQVHYAMTR